MARGLTDKQKLFIAHYVDCLNATEAALRAGYEGDRQTLAVIGYQNLRKLQIKRAIDKKLNDVAMGANEILVRLTDEARGDLTQFIGLTEVQLKEHPQSHLIKKYKRTETTGENFTTVHTEVELYDSQAAKVHLGRHRKLWTDKMEHSGEDGGPIPIAIIKMDVDEL